MPSPERCQYGLLSPDMSQQRSCEAGALFLVAGSPSPPNQPATRVLAQSNLSPIANPVSMRERVTQNDYEIKRDRIRHVTYMLNDVAVLPTPQRVEGGTLLSKREIFNDVDNSRVITSAACVKQDLPEYPWRNLEAIWRICAVEGRGVGVSWMGRGIVLGELPVAQFGLDLAHPCELGRAKGGCGWNSSWLHLGAIWRILDFS